MNRFIVLFLAVVIISCQSSEKNTGKHNFGYPQISKIFKEQEIALVQNGRGLQKMAVLNKQMENATILPNNTDWDKELSVFQEIDLNRPSYLGFIVKDSLAEPNGYTITYKTNKETIPIKELKIQYTSDRKMKVMDCSILKENELSKTQKFLHAEFDIESSINLLKTYSIKSTQKVVFKDELFTQVSGIVLGQK